VSNPFRRLKQSLGFGREEMAGEFAAGSLLGRTRAGNAGDFQLGPDDGVRVSPLPVTALSQVTIRYNGLLAKGGAKQVYLHCGEGPGEWRNVRDVPMKPGETGDWYAQVEVGDSPAFEFCFHDGSGNWDNNNGADWSVTVHSGRNPH